MLGETYELVTDRLRFISEKIEHVPKQVVCFNMEGDGYEFNTYNNPDPKFKFNGGKGMIEFSQVGAYNIHMKKFDEHISVSKPKIQGKNIIWGGIYFDIDGQIEAINHKTGEKVIIKFMGKSGDNKQLGKLEGKAYNS